MVTHGLGKANSKARKDDSIDSHWVSQIVRHLHVPPASKIPQVKYYRQVNIDW